jgi:hypothetical protein
VIATQTGDREPRVELVVLVESGARIPSSDAVHDELTARLPALLVPDRVVVVGSADASPPGVPLTLHGKLDRRAVLTCVPAPASDASPRAKRVHADGREQPASLAAAEEPGHDDWRVQLWRRAVRQPGSAWVPERDDVLLACGADSMSVRIAAERAQHDCRTLTFGAYAGTVVRGQRARLLTRCAHADCWPRH